MSSLKNIRKAKQKPHRERGQPSERRHMGELEKKSDYKQRATDYQKKRDTLRFLHKKAIEKNPDEFFFHMVNAKLKNGMHEDAVKDEHTPEQQKLMKSQNLRYIQHKLNIERRKIEKLQSSFHFFNVEPKNKHTFFVDSKEEALAFDPAQHLNTHAMFLTCSSNRPRENYLNERHVLGASGSTSLANEVAKKSKAGYEELAKRWRRKNELDIVRRKLEIQRSLEASKAMKPKKVRRGKPNRAPVYIWPQERQR